MGIHFKLNEGKYEVVNHNYMRSLWALLILMAICSYLAQRKWANIFTTDTLRALLQLPGSEELPLVRKAQELRAHEELMKLASVNQTITRNNNNNARSVAGDYQSHQRGTNFIEGSTSKQLIFRDAFGDQGQLFVHKIDILVGDDNDHNHALDYYPNQLIYLLLMRKTSAYKLANLRLRRKLLAYSAWSLFLSSMQFVLPWCFIGRKYTLYGWNFARLAFHHILDQLSQSSVPALATSSSSSSSTQPQQVNSFDYELTSSIWPTSTQCEYKQFGLQGLERVVVQCTVPINEICGKLFAVIWWVVAINIAIELWCFAVLLLCSLNSSTIQASFGRRFWPGARAQAKIINTFRYRHASLLARVEAEAVERRILALEAAADFQQLDDQHHHLPLTAATNGHNRQEETRLAEAAAQITRQVTNAGHNVQQRHHRAASGRTPISGRRAGATSERERKQFEAARERPGLDSLSLSNNSLASKKWYLWCPRDLGCFLADKGKRLSSRKQRGATIDDDELNSSSADGYLSAIGGDAFGEKRGSSGWQREQQHENKHDPDLYYLLYFLYLRLDCSRKKVEQVIQMTSEALSCYLNRLEQFEWSSSAAASSAGADEPLSSSTTSTTIIPSASFAAGQQQQQQQQ